MIDSAQLVGANGAVCQISTNQIPLRTFEVQTDEVTDETQKIRDHGLWDAFDYMGKMVIHFEGDILGHSPTEYWNLRSDLAAPMVPVPELGYTWVTRLLVTFTGWPGEQVSTYCSIESRLDAKLDATQGPSWSNFQFALKARDPRFYSSVMRSAQSSTPGTGGGLSFPLIFRPPPNTLNLHFNAQTGGSVVLQNSGNANTYPEIQINGPCSGPSLIASFGGNSYTWSMSNFNIVQGGSVTVNMKALTAIYFDGFDTHDVFAFVDPLSIWWFMPPGITNAQFAAASPGSGCNALFEWPNAYVIA